MPESQVPVVDELVAIIDVLAPPSEHGHRPNQRARALGSMQWDGGASWTSVDDRIAAVLARIQNERAMSPLQVCPRCGGSGWAVDRRGEPVHCPKCHGSGFIGSSH